MKINGFELCYHDNQKCRGCYECPLRMGKMHWYRPEKVLLCTAACVVATAIYDGKRDYLATPQLDPPEQCFYVKRALQRTAPILNRILKLHTWKQGDDEGENWLYTWLLAIYNRWHVEEAYRTDFLAAYRAYAGR